MTERGVDRDELEAAIGARKELGADMEPAVIDALVERSSGGSWSGATQRSAR